MFLYWNQYRINVSSKIHWSTGLTVGYCTKYRLQAPKKYLEASSCTLPYYPYTPNLRSILGPILFVLGVCNFVIPVDETRFTTHENVFHPYPSPYSSHYLKHYSRH